MNLLLFGAPGTGKGTQSAFLISKYKIRHISTGDLFRKALREKTSLGLQAMSYMDQGKLVPDSVVVALIREVLVDFSKKKKQGFILDGFPRTLVQAIALESLLNDLKLQLDKVLYLNVPTVVLIERIVGRRVAEKSGCVYHIKFNPPQIEGVCDKSGEKLIHRNDDRREVVMQRLKAYREETAPLIEYYRKKNILFELDGNDSPEKVFLLIQKVLEN